MTAPAELTSMRLLLCAECKECVSESLATGKPVSTLSMVRVKTRDGWQWFENRFCFNGLRWYAVFRDASKAKKTEVRAACV